MQVSTIADTTGGAPPPPGTEILWWPHIDQTISLVAFLLGLLLMIISNFAGARENRTKMIFTVLLSTAIAALSMPLFIFALEWAGTQSGNWARVVLIIFSYLFITTVAVHAYEIVIVTAREARPPE